VKLMAFEYIPGKTLFHRLDPRTKFLYWAVVITLAVSLGTDPIFTFALFLSLLVVIRMSKIPLGKVGEFLKGIAPVAGMYALFNMLFPPTATQFSKPYVFFYVIPNLLPITLEGIIWTFGAVLRFLIILLVVRTILMITPIRDLIIALIKLKLPPEFGMALSIGFAYVPVLIDENTKIKEAQQARGWKYEYRNPAKRFNALLRQMFIPAIFNSIRRTGDIAIAIESRGFSHNVAGRTYMRQLKYTKEDYAMTIALIAIFIGGIAVGPWGLKWAYYLNSVEAIKRFLQPHV
jgi:energy-coupling factor transport system permease protein